MTTSASLRFTYDDYLLLPEDRRYEVIDGDLLTTPTPGTPHQRIVGNLYLRLCLYVEDHQLGEVLIAPCDVVLSPTDVVQPDLLFVAASRAAIVGEKFISAAPDLVVEVLSPSTEDRDRTVKTKLYARFGVRELWIADPEKENRGPHQFRRRLPARSRLRPRHRPSLNPPSGSRDPDRRGLQRVRSSSRGKPG